jgi:TPP-dependent indolepyruvate ferredoxin oxidoreductase alpha subunit
MQFPVSKPEGCQAAVFYTEKIVKNGSGFLSTQIGEISSQIICGMVERRSLPHQWGKVLLESDHDRVYEELKQDTEQLLGALCMGCPHRQTVQVESVQV